MSDTYPQATWGPPWPKEKWPDVGLAPELRPVDFPLDRDRSASVQPTTVPVLPASPDPGAASLADRVEFSPVPTRAGREGDSQGLPIVRPGAADIQSAVIADIEARREVGISRYGTALQAHNGRNALLDLYEELLDACMYAKQRLVEDSAYMQVPGKLHLPDGGWCSWDDPERTEADGWYVIYVRSEDLEKR